MLRQRNKGIHADAVEWAVSELTGEPKTATPPSKDADAEDTAETT